jgi:hypothetical protein
MTDNNEIILFTTNEKPVSLPQKQDKLPTTRGNINKTSSKSSQISLKTPDIPPNSDEIPPPFPVNSKKLTKKEALFCEIYAINGGDRISAYREVYKTQGSYSVVNADSYKLMKIPTIALRIRELQDEAEVQLKKDRELTRQDVLDRFMEARDKALNRRRIVWTTKDVVKGTDLLGQPITEQMKVKEVIDDPDFSTAKEYDKMIANISGILKDTSIEITQKFFIEEN